MSRSGVSRTAPLSLSSDYHTTFNHSFRDTTAIRTKRQNKLKCPSCGVWGKLGQNCALCQIPIPCPKRCWTAARSSPSKPMSPPPALSLSKAKVTTPQQSPKTRQPSLSTAGSRPPTTATKEESSPVAARQATAVAAPLPPTPRGHDAAARVGQRSLSASSRSSSSSTSTSSIAMESVSITVDSEAAQPVSAPAKVICDGCGLYRARGRPCSLCGVLSE